MKKELQNRLAEEFPFMRCKPEEAIGDFYCIVDIDVGDGWYGLLYDMCKEITEVLETEGESVNLVVEQIKEKFGGLRFYFHLNREKQESLHLLPGEDRVYEEIFNIAEKYEDRSWDVCEICGCGGTLRRDLIWMSTLCDKCYSKYDESAKRKRM